MPTSATSSSRPKGTPKKAARRHRQLSGSPRVRHLPHSAAYALVAAWAKGVVGSVSQRLLPSNDLDENRGDLDDSAFKAAFNPASRTDSDSSASSSSEAWNTHHNASQHKTLLHLPPEILFRIFELLPTSSLSSLLVTSPNVTNVSLVASCIMTTRSHYVLTLEDLRSFTHDVPVTCMTNRTTTTEFSHQLKKKQIGPVFYRSGTMILFARHFTRLIPEARVLLGVGYAMVLAWFMCLFYLVPFAGEMHPFCSLFVVIVFSPHLNSQGALTLYFAMDIVDLSTRSLSSLLHSLPTSLLAALLPQTHPLHPLHPPVAPHVPAHLVHRLTFAAPVAPIVAGLSEPLRCCGLAGTAWSLGGREGFVESTLTGQPCVDLEGPLTVGEGAAGGGKSVPFWGLMSSYTPWHLYLLTHSISEHPEVTHLTLSRISLAWWFRVERVPNVQVLVMHACELDETGIGLVARACVGVKGFVLRGSE
ncbi:hypothetical protein HDU98_001382, partial [Podochytrium sp. JEL0797]